MYKTTYAAKQKFLALTCYNSFTPPKQTRPDPATSALCITRDPGLCQTTSLAFLEQIHPWVCYVSRQTQQTWFAKWDRTVQDLSVGHCLPTAAEVLKISMRKINKEPPTTAISTIDAVLQGQKRW